MVEARLAEASTRVGGYGLRVGSAALPYPTPEKSGIQGRTNMQSRIAAPTFVPVPGSEDRWMLNSDARSYGVRRGHAL